MNEAPGGTGAHWLGGVAPLLPFLVGGEEFINRLLATRLSRFDILGAPSLSKTFFVMLILGTGEIAERVVSLLFRIITTHVFKFDFCVYTAQRGQLARYRVDYTAAVPEAITVSDAG